MESSTTKKRKEMESSTVEEEMETSMESSTTFKEDPDWSRFEKEVCTKYEGEFGGCLEITMVELPEFTKFKETAQANLKATANKLEAIEYKKIWADGNVVNDVFTLFTLRKAKFLLSGEGKKVPISHLKGKVVGLYFYTALTDAFVFRELGYMYDVLRQKYDENFELVFIPKCRYMPVEVIRFVGDLMFNREDLYEKKFEKFFKGKPWLALPFAPSRVTDELHFWSETLRDSCEPAELVIVRPDEDIYIAHAYAMDIFREFGIAAYPFSKSRLTEFVVERLQSWTLLASLSSCFGESGPVVVSDKNGTVVPLLDLSGKKILLFLDPCRDELVYKKVSGWYKEMKQKDDEFEIVRGCYNKYKDEDENFPWLDLLSYSKNAYLEMNAIFKYTGMKVKMDRGIPIFLAFGRDGNFITVTSPEKSIYDDDCQTSPDFFDDVHLYGQVALNIAIEKRWRQLHEDDGEVYYHDEGRVHYDDDGCVQCYY